MERGPGSGDVTSADDETLLFDDDTLKGEANLALFFP